MSDDPRQGADVDRTPTPTQEPADQNPHQAVDQRGARVEPGPEVQLATEALKLYQHDRWVEVSDRVLAAALTATRRTRPVRAHAAGGSLQVSEQVLIAYLRAAIDDAVPGTAVNRITVTLTGRDTFESVIIQLLVRYRLPILPAADVIHEIAARVLTDVLGPPADQVDIRLTHVHVDDVTTDDPATHDS